VLISSSVSRVNEINQRDQDRRRPVSSQLASNRDPFYQRRSACERPCGGTSGGVSPGSFFKTPHARRVLGQSRRRSCYGATVRCTKATAACTTNEDIRYGCRTLRACFVLRRFVFRKHLCTWRYIILGCDITE
jgi:hypothetical protein